MTFGSLFAGIGGMDLGIERAGLDCQWQVEIDDYARRVLAKHWPDVRRHDDIRTFPPTEASKWRVDLIAGGFPCQDVSNAGRRRGIDGERSGLWQEMLRVVRVLRPRFVLVENTPGMLSRGLGRVLGDLAKIGYDAEWESLPAAAFGAPHIRDRVFVVAYPNCERSAEQRPGAAVFPHPASQFARQLRRVECEGSREETWGLPWAEGESRVSRVANGVPHRVDCLRGLGNAVVPQVAEWIGRRLIESTR